MIESYQFATKTKALGKWFLQTFQGENLVNPSNLIKLNTSKFLSLFHNQNLWKDTIILVLITGEKSLLIDLQGVLMATWVSIWYKFINFPHPLITVFRRIGNSPNILFPRSREQDESHPMLYSTASYLNYTRLYIRGLINLNYTFNMPFKVNPKAKAIINGGFIFQLHDDIVQRFLTLLEMFFRYFIKMNMKE